MKRFNNKVKDKLYLLYRLVSPIIDPVKAFSGITEYPRFFRDLKDFKSKNSNLAIKTKDFYPMLDDRINFTPFDAHYFFQQLWVFENVLKEKPAQHIDVGSTYALSGYLSKITNATFIDYRPIDTKLKNLKILRGDILKLPIEDNSVVSLSSLHVVEHIGLGRYGDPIDPDGLIKACKELQRVLKPGGKLYLSTPIGEERVCFNAHRVSNPEKIVQLFDQSILRNLDVVDDDGVYNKNVGLRGHERLSYGCGMFTFEKK